MGGCEHLGLLSLPNWHGCGYIPGNGGGTSGSASVTSLFGKPSCPGSGRAGQMNAVLKPLLSVAETKEIVNVAAARTVVLAKNDMRWKGKGGRVVG